MTPMWARRREDMLSDCLVSPDVFTQMVERLGAFVVPYQQALETEADQHPMHLYLQGLLSENATLQGHISANYQYPTIDAHAAAAEQWIRSLKVFQSC